MDNWEIARKEINIVDLVLSSPLEVKFINGRYTAKCFAPDHNDSHPSLFINPPEKGNFIFCFGCHKTWDTISFTQWVHGCTPHEALKILMQQYPQKFPDANIQMNVKRWKGINAKEFEAIGLSNNIYFQSDCGNDCLSMRELQQKDFSLYEKIILNALDKKNKELDSLVSFADENGKKKIESERKLLENIKMKIPLNY